MYCLPYVFLDDFANEWRQSLIVFLIDSIIIVIVIVIPQLVLAIKFTKFLKAVLCALPPAVPPAPAERFPPPNDLSN